MKYIVHRRYKGPAADGEHMNIPYGAEFETIGDFIATPEGKAICAVGSEVCHRYFAQNDDGQGLARGALTYAIAYSPRHKKCANGAVYRFSDEEQELLVKNWSHFLVEDVTTILFNNSFFAAQVPELRLLANVLNIKVRR